jgi:hypothetical protein
MARLTTALEAIAMIALLIAATGDAFAGDWGNAAVVLLAMTAIALSGR